MNKIPGYLQFSLTLLLAAQTADAQTIENIDLKGIKIGNQNWQIRNLDVSTFRNGDEIPQAKSLDELLLIGETNPSWCYYNFDPANGEKYGKLYNWYTVNDSRGLCPSGWHVPSNNEWITLIDFLGGDSIAGTKMKTTGDWKNGNGTNTSGFAGLPSGAGGYRKGGEDLFFNFIGNNGAWWSSAKVDAEKDNTQKTAWIFVLSFDNTKVDMVQNYKARRVSVRCIRD